MAFQRGVSPVAEYGHRRKRHLSCGRERLTPPPEQPVARAEEALRRVFDSDE